MAAEASEREDHLPIHMGCVPVEATVGVLPPETVVLQDVQHARHLAEDEDTVSLLS